MKALMVACAALCVSLLLSCSTGPEIADSGGGGIETVSMRGTALLADQTPAKGARVFVRKRGYLPDVSRLPYQLPHDAVVDDTGGFYVDSIDTGEYCIEINYKDSAAILVKRRLEDVNGNLGLLTLSATGALHGKVTVEDTAAHTLYALIYGLERAVEINPFTGSYSATGLPAGDYDIRIVSEDGALAPADNRDIAVVSGGSAYAGIALLWPDSAGGYSAWSYRKSIVLNTTANGANIASDVYRLPLLVQIDTTVIPSGQAASDGRDIRFAQPDGSPLPFEIEYWVASGAAVWVLVDTVYGNAVDTIILYWGNSNAANISRAAAVFDTALGFAGVWHMGDEAGSGVVDASMNGNDGVDSVSAAPVAGVAGQCRAFSKDQADFVQIDRSANSSLSFSGDFTVACWFRTTQTAQAQGWPQMVAMRENAIGGGFSLAFWDAQRSGYGLFELVSTAASDTPGVSVTTQTAYNDGPWHYAVGIKKDTTISLYIDGVLQNSANWQNHSIASDAPLMFGGLGGNLSWSYFDGALDEIRISNVARSDSWIKLCYESQRPGSVLIAYTD